MSRYLPCPCCGGAVRRHQLPVGARLVCEGCGASARASGLVLVDDVYQRRVANSLDRTYRSVGHDLRDAILAVRACVESPEGAQAAFYEWLADELDLDGADAHFGMLNGADLYKAVIACGALIERLRKKPRRKGKKQWNDAIKQVCSVWKQHRGMLRVAPIWLERAVAKAQ